MKIQNSKRILVMDDAFLKTVSGGVEQTFLSLFDVAVKKKTASDREVKSFSRELTSVVGFYQESLDGLLSISFKKDDAFKCLGKIFNEDLNQIDERILSSVVEIANIVYGLIKEQLNTKGFDFQICLPVAMLSNGGTFTFESVVKDHSYTTESIIFEAAAWSFVVDISVRAHKKPENVRKMINKNGNHSRKKEDVA